ncbi:MAG: asparaginase domain-containing protein [Bacteriovoracia bacterium]
MAINDVRPLTILTTGGTIEKIYDENEGTLQNRDTIIKNKILQKLRLPYTDIRVKSLMAKDSLYMDEDDRKIICDSIAEHEKLGFPIVILHGTDTMDVTASYCFEHHKPKVAVVLTGAMKPMGFDDSDATQNVVEAIFAAHMLTPGYWVTFHGRLFSVPGFRKNRQKGTFEAIE